jgi:hypothetical protein
LIQLTYEAAGAILAVQAGLLWWLLKREREEGYMDACEDVAFGNIKIELRYHDDERN